MSSLKSPGVYEASGYVVALRSGETRLVDRSAGYWFVYRNEDGRMVGCTPGGKPFDSAEAAVAWVLEEASR